MSKDITREEDYILHVEAGLLDYGKDEDGDDTWMGTNKEWATYSELVTKFKEENNIPF